MLGKTLLLGAKGMLGQALTRTWQDQDLVAWDVDDLDITDQNKVLEKVIEIKPDLIINAAAYTDVDGAESNRVLAFKVNADGIRNIAEAAQAVGAGIVHYSTDYVFPGDKAKGYSEEEAPGPAVNIYGETKLAGERALIEVSSKFWLIRTAWLYGMGGKNFVDTMLKLSQEKNELKVVDDQHGTPTFVNDLAKFTWILINEKYASGIYHGVNQGVTTWFDLAEKIFDLTDRKVTVEPIKSSEFPRPAKRPEFSVLLNNRGPNMRTWEEALAEYLREKE
jgi:dTDP-4-dehydrorhamnose reductase